MANDQDQSQQNLPGSEFVKTQSVLTEEEWNGRIPWTRAQRVALLHDMADVSEQHAYACMYQL